MRLTSSAFEHQEKIPATYTCDGDNINPPLDISTEAVGEEGCRVACQDAEIFQDEEGWKLFLEGFMEPWFLGKTVDKASIREFASMGFGLNSFPS